MPTSIRLDATTESLVRRLAREKGVSKSEVIRRALRDAARREARDTRTPYQAMKHLIGAFDSGGARLSERTGEKVTALLREKARARRPR